MSHPNHLTDRERTRTKRLAAGALVLAPLVTIGIWLAGGQSGYESRLFVLTHVGSLLAGILLALGATSTLYAAGFRRLGVAGLAGTAFAWIGVGATALWVPIAWQATVFARTGSSSLGVFTSLFSPLGSGYFVSVMFLYALAVAGLAIGLRGTGLVHGAIAGLAAVCGGVAAVWMLNTIVTAMPETVTSVTIVLTIVLWAVLLPLGGSLYLRSQSAASEGDDSETGSRVSAND